MKIKQTQTVHNIRLDEQSISIIDTFLTNIANKTDLSKSLSSIGKATFFRNVKRIKNGEHGCDLFSTRNYAQIIAANNLYAQKYKRKRI